MGSVLHIRAALLEIKRFTEETGTVLHRMTAVGDNLDLVEFDEGLVLLREAIAELETVANGASELRIRLWERLGAEGLDK
jgi:hypothetical protein